MKRLWILVAALVLAACSSSQTVATPTASAAVEDYGPPPAGVPLMYLADPRHAGWYVGVDWTGKPRATLKLSQPIPAPQFLLPAPDGSAFLIPAFKGMAGAFLDPLGSPIVDPDTQQPQYMMWADTGGRLCTLGFSGGLKGQWLIGLKTPGSPAATHAVAIDSPNLHSGIIAIDFRSCSPGNDRAVLAYNYMERPSEVWVVRISDGKVLLHQTHPPNVLADITASSDGTLIAEDSGKSIGYLMGPTAPNTTVRRVADGSVVAQLDPSYFVVAFSRDDSLALVSTSPLAAGSPTNLALVRLADGAVLWHQGSNEELGGRWVRSDGNDIAFQLGPSTIVIVHPDGTAASFRLP